MKNKTKAVISEELRAAQHRVGQLILSVLLLSKAYLSAETYRLTACKLLADERAEVIRLRGLLADRMALVAGAE